jgi:hypothetical protein
MPTKPFLPRNNVPIVTDTSPKIFKAGARHYLHPKLAILDQIDCVLEYHPDTKTIIVSYAPETRKKDYTDYTETTYTKTIMSSTIDFIVEVICKDYINPLREEIQTKLNGEPE